MLVVISAFGCNKAVPSVAGCEKVSVATLRSLYRHYPHKLAIDAIIGAVVVSSDRQGEHYHQLVLQDPTGGIVVSIDCDELFQHYAIGDSLVVRLFGLTLGGYGGEPRLGDEPSGGNEVSPIEWNKWQAIATKVAKGVELNPPRVRIADIGPEYVSRLVVVEGVRFVEAGQCWAEEGVPTSRHLVDVEVPTDTLTVRASGRSDFWWHRLPQGELSSSGIVGYFGGEYQFVIGSPESLNLSTE